MLCRGILAALNLPGYLLAQVGWAESVADCVTGFRAQSHQVAQWQRLYDLPISTAQGHVDSCRILALSTSVQHAFIAKLLS